MTEFSEGQDVFLYTHAGAMIKAKIRKRYKNGNFVLERNNDQFSADGHGRGNWSRACFVEVNEKTQAEYDFRALRNALSSVIRDIKDWEFQVSDAPIMKGIYVFLAAKRAELRAELSQ